MEFGDRFRTHINSMQQPSENSPCCMPSVPDSRTFCSSNRTPIPPHPTMATTNPLSQWTGLFWMFPINGMIYGVIFCVWLLSLSIMFSRFIHVYVLWLSNSSEYGWTTFCLSSHQFMDVWDVSTLWFYAIQGFVWVYVFISLG